MMQVKAQNNVIQLLRILTDYVAIEPRVCVSVCASVCVISTAQTVEPILIKLSINDCEYICEYHFSQFLKFRI